jgi:hypothetical protein
VISGCWSSTPELCWPELRSSLRDHLHLGYALRRAKFRDMNAFIAWNTWSGPPGRTKEVLIEDGVPDAAAHLIEVRRV